MGKFRSWLESSSELYGMAKAAILANCKSNPYVDWLPCLVAADAATEAGLDDFADFIRVLAQPRHPAIPRYPAKNHGRRRTPQQIKNQESLARLLPAAQEVASPYTTFKFPWHEGPNGSKASACVKMPYLDDPPYPDDPRRIEDWEFCPLGYQFQMADRGGELKTIVVPPWSMFGLTRISWYFSRFRHDCSVPPPADDAYRFVRPATDDDILKVFAAALVKNYETAPMHWE